jgi:hypothetical protein
MGLRPTTIVAPLVRKDLDLPSGGGSRTRVVARWSDGTPAAIETTLGDGCVREIGVGVPLAGDLTLRAPFRHFLAALVEPCGGARGVALSDSALTWLTAPGPLASGSALADAADVDRKLPLWLLSIALVLLAAESVARRRGGVTAS